MAIITFHPQELRQVIVTGQLGAVFVATLIFAVLQLVLEVSGQVAEITHPQNIYVGWEEGLGVRRKKQGYSLNMLLA